VDSLGSSSILWSLVLALDLTLGLALGLVLVLWLALSLSLALLVLFRLWSGQLLWVCGFVWYDVSRLVTSISI